MSTVKRAPVPEAIKGLPSWGKEEAALVTVLETWADRRGARFDADSQKAKQELVATRDAAQAKLQAKNRKTGKPWSASEVKGLLGRLEVLCDELRALLSNVATRSEPDGLASYKAAKQAILRVKEFARVVCAVHNGTKLTDPKWKPLPGDKGLMKRFLWQLYKSHPGLQHYGRIHNSWHNSSRFTKRAKRDYEERNRKGSEKYPKGTGLRAAARRATRLAMTDEQRRAANLKRAERRREQKRRERSEASPAAIDATVEDV